MRLDCSIDGLYAELSRDALIVRFDRMKVISSAVLNPGVVEARSIINYRVREWFDDPSALMERVVERLDPPRPCVGMMTMADIGMLGHRSSNHVEAFVTASIGNPLAAGDRIHGMPMGTINMIVIVDGDMGDGCLVDAVRTAIEAKVLELRYLDVRSVYSGEFSSGTVSDAIAIACTLRGERFDYSGPGTELGSEIAICVREALREALERHDRIFAGRPMERRLEEYGIGIEGIEGLLYSILGRRIEVRGILSDPNIASLLLMAMRMDEEGAHGLIPHLSAIEFSIDPERLVADEILGESIARYIAGERGEERFRELERIDLDGPIDRLGPFTKDALRGLVAGVVEWVDQGA